MSGYVTKDEKSSAYKILSKMLENALASEMSFDGKTGKIQFKNTNVHKVLDGECKLVLSPSSLHKK